MTSTDQRPPSEIWREATLEAIQHESDERIRLAEPVLRFPTIRRFLRQPTGVIAALFLLLLVVVAFAGPLIAPTDPNVQNLGNILKPPSPEALLGTDDLGRDVLSRLIFGARISLQAVVQATLIAVLAGTPLGIIAGYVGGRLDRVIMTINDAVMSFPGLLLAIAVVALLGPGLSNAMVAVGIVFAPRMLRLARGATLSVRHETYIEASRSIGTPGPVIVSMHVLRNVRSPLLVEASLLAGRVLLAEASLSFLGLGAQYPDASWGAMLGRSFDFISRAPLLMVWPGIAIALTVWAFNLVGDAVGDSYGREGRKA